MELINTDIFTEILTYLEISDIVSLLSVSKYISNLINNSSIWKYLGFNSKLDYINFYTGIISNYECDAYMGLSHNYVLYGSGKLYKLLLNSDNCIKSKYIKYYTDTKRIYKLPLLKDLIAGDKCLVLVSKKNEVFYFPKRLDYPIILTSPKFKDIKCRCIYEFILVISGFELYCYNIRYESSSGFFKIIHTPSLYKIKDIYQNHDRSYLLEVWDEFENNKTLTVPQLDFKLELDLIHDSV